MHSSNHSPLTRRTARRIVPCHQQYLFEETSNNPGGTDGTWQDSPILIDTGLTTGTSYTYRVKARDKSPNANETGWSSSLSAAPSLPPGDYDTWSAIYAPADLTDPNADFDNDGLTNDTERAFGLNPTSGSSVNPISVPFNRAAGTFSYTRRNPTLTKMVYTVWTSTTLGAWTEDPAAVQTPGTADANGMQIVGVTLTPGLLAAPALFVRVRALEPAAP